MGRGFISTPILGSISLLADMYYKCARSITGQYMLMFGATATIVGLVAGIGELLGYALRVSFGFIADTKRYWSITSVGYILIGAYNSSTHLAT